MPNGQYQFLSPSANLKSFIIVSGQWTTTPQNQPTSRSTVHCSDLLSFLPPTFRYPFRRTIAFRKGKSSIHLEAEIKCKWRSYKNALTSWAIAGVTVFISLSAHTAVLARARIAWDVFAFAVVPRETFVTSATENIQKRT